MPASNAFDVTLQQAAPRGIAAVRARVPASRAGAHFRTHLDQVYAAGRTGAMQLDGQNVFVCGRCMVIGARVSRRAPTSFISSRRTREHG